MEVELTIDRISGLVDELDNLIEKIEELSPNIHTKRIYEINNRIAEIIEVTELLEINLN